MKLIVLLSLFAVCSLSAPSYFNAFTAPLDAPKGEAAAPIAPKMEPTSHDQEKIAGQASGNSTSPLEDTEGSGETSGEEKEEEKREEKEEDRGSSSSSESGEKKREISREKKGSPSGGSEEKAGSEDNTTMSVDEATQVH